jgi:hypothetical protein
MADTAKARLVLFCKKEPKNFAFDGFNADMGGTPKSRGCCVFFRKEALS